MYCNGAFKVCTFSTQNLKPLLVLPNLPRTPGTSSSRFRLILRIVYEDEFVSIVVVVTKKF